MAMRKYIVRRIALYIYTLLGVSLVIFIVLRVLPGDVAQIMFSRW